jgi:hypothetical protein
MFLSKSSSDCSKSLIPENVIPDLLFRKGAEIFPVTICPDG